MRRPVGQSGQSGQSATEYLVALVLLLALIALPVAGDASVVELWRRAVAQAYARFVFALAGLV